MRKVVAGVGVAAGLACTGEVPVPERAELAGCTEADRVVDEVPAAPDPRTALAAGPAARPEDRFLGVTVARVGKALHTVAAHPDPERVLASGTPPVGSIEGGVLLCRITAAAPRGGRRSVVDVRLAVEGMPEVARLGDPGPAVWITVPAARVADGATLELSATHRDEGCDWRWWLTGVPICWDQRHGLGTARSSFRGTWPVRLAGDGVDARCEARDPGASLAEALASVDGALDAACAEADRARSPADLQRVRREPVDDALAVAASLVGWADPRVTARSARADRLDAARRADARRWAGELDATAVPAGTPVTLGQAQLIVSRPLTCEGRRAKGLPRAGRCAFGLSVRAGSGRTVLETSAGLVRVDGIEPLLLWPDGRGSTPDGGQVSAGGRKLEELVRLEPGQLAELEAWVDTDDVPARGPDLLRLGEHWLSLR